MSQNNRYIKCRHASRRSSFVKRISLSIFECIVLSLLRHQDEDNVNEYGVCLIDSLLCQCFIMHDRKDTRRITYSNVMCLQRDSKSSVALQKVLASIDTLRIGVVSSLVISKLTLTLQIYPIETQLHYNSASLSSSHSAAFSESDVSASSPPCTCESSKSLCITGCSNLLLPVTCSFI